MSRARFPQPALASKYLFKMWSLSLRPSVALFVLAGLASVNAKLTLKAPKFSVLSDAGSVLRSDSYVDILV